VHISGPNYFIVSMIGAVVLFSGLGAAALALYMGAGVMAFWLLGVVFVGMIILVVGTFLKKDTYGT